MKILTFDNEIQKCIPEKGVPNDPRYKYCEGWKDYENMGIALVAVACNWNKKTTFYNEQNILEQIGRAHV